VRSNIQNRAVVVQKDPANARGPAVVPPKAKWTANQLSNAGRQMDPADSSGRWTKAGRAAQKHGQRPADTLFPEQTGRADQMNKNGQAILDQILKHPDATWTNLGKGGVQVLHPDGRAARFSAEGTFDGFVQK